MAKRNKVLLVIEVLLLVLGLGANAIMFVQDYPNLVKIVAEAPMPEGGEMMPPEGQMPGEGQMQPAGQMPGEGQMQPAGQMPGEGFNVLPFVINHVLPLIMYIMVVIYGFISYKKPHGNVLRYAMFTFSVYLALMIATAGSNGYACGYLLPLAAVMAAYMSGRLNKIEKNKWLMIIETVLLAAFVVTESMHTGTNILPVIVSSGSHLIIWLLLIIAYIVRYQEHKEAGAETEA